jgi:hypothetical protein
MGASIEHNRFNGFSIEKPLKRLRSFALSLVTSLKRVVNEIELTPRC